MSLHMTFFHFIHQTFLNILDESIIMLTSGSQPFLARLCLENFVNVKNSFKFCLGVLVFH
jgi:hypothetical protein